ncbi:MAG: fumarylacetoacetate hydrolase family protein, partial [Aestuariivirgaceae bacterium]
DLHYEGELVIVMGARAKDVSEKDALKYVFGVTAGNDITEHGYGRSPFVVLKAKGADSMSPLGPLIVAGLDYDRLALETRVNGKVVQKTSTSKMIRSCARIIAELSRYMTLEPGDVIYTGTPGKTGPLKPGDVVEVEIEGVGTLKNIVAKPQ